jgi:hypothetical protein
MYPHGRLICLAFLLIQILDASASWSAEPGEADELVRRALNAELAGNNADRQALLQEVVRSFPDHAPARWQLGFVMVGGDWLEVAEAERRTVESRLTQQYRRLRDQCAQTATGQVALARWCRQNKLADEERLHWVAVLQLDPSHHEARSRLAVREYRGMLLTKSDVEQYEARQKAYDQAQAYWKPRLTKLRRTIEGSEAVAREAALAELRTIDDEAAIPAVEEVLSTADELLGLAAIDIISGIKGQAATDSLIRHAVLSDHDKVREAAADELRSRSPYSYVPALLANLQAPVELSYFVQTLQDGVRYGYEAVQERPEGTYAYARSHSIRTAVELPRSLDSGQVLTSSSVARASGTAQTRFARDSSLLQSWGRQVSNANLKSAMVNARILRVLRTATQKQLSDDPREWWKWWVQQNELYAPRRQQEKQVATSQLVVARLQETALKGPGIPLPQDGTITHSRSTATARSGGGWGNGFFLSCFLPGTMVWTDTGMVPIEKVRIGDRVLSQDQDSGELTYKLVIDATIRPPSPTLRLGMGDEEIATTMGHLLWVTGLGWQMAKEVQVGDQLHGVHGGQTVDYIKPGPESEAYNLVVADFSTYFIGRYRILVHDNRPRLVTEARLPGLVGD